MQNIPGILLEKTSEQLKAMKTPAIEQGDQTALFADLFNEHSASVEKELAYTPVATQDKVVEMTHDAVSEEPAVNAAGTEAPVHDTKAETTDEDLDRKMTQEDVDEVRDDLEQYGFSEEEIAEIEKKVNSEEGMTWREFTAEVDEKIEAMRKTELTDDQKNELNSFFGKFGFTDEESKTLIGQLEDGQYAKVMQALEDKLDSLPEGQQLLLSKKEIEAFTTVLGFSKEFSQQVKELLSTNSLPKDVKSAFSLIQQKMKGMDKKDQELVNAVGKAFAKSMGENAKDSSAARVIAEAVDLKPRVAEEELQSDIKQELTDALKSNKDSLPERQARGTTEKSLADKTNIKTDAEMGEADESQQDNDSNERWNDMFNRTRDDSSRADQAASKKAVDALGKTGLAQSDAVDAAKTKAWEKVSAPKVLKQVENGILRTLNNGSKQLTLQLNPENLGKLSIVLTVQGKEVGATIRAEHADAAKVITENLDIIKNSLESQGLKVEKLDVQTGLNSNQNSYDWFGQNEHNMAREREAMIAMRSHMKQMRENGGDAMAQDLQNIRQQAINADNGLHVIA